MRKYQGYTLESVLDEYAIRFYALLEQSFRLDAIEKMDLLEIACAPHMETGPRQEIVERYKNASSDILETGFGETAEDSGAINLLKKELG